MKICHITDGIPIFHEKIGGAEWAAYRVIKNQIKMLDVFIITAKRTKKAEKTDMKIYEIPINFEGFITKIRLGILPFNRKVYREVKKILIKEKPDMVHLHNFKFFGFSALKAAKDLKIKIVYSVYDYWLFCPLSMLYIKKTGKVCKTFHGYGCIKCFNFPGVGFYFRKGLFEKYFRLIDWFFVISRDSKDILVHNGISSEKITVTSLVLDIPKTRLKTKKIKKTILYVGWVVPHKGLDVIIKGLKGTDYKLFAIGDTNVNPKYFEKCKNLSRDLNVNVDFVGRIPYKEVINYMKQCEYLAVAEQWRIPLPTVMLEAMSFGSKVIGSNIGCMKDFLPNQNLFNNEKDVVKCLKRAKFLKRNFDNKKVISDIVKIYKSLLS